MYRKLIKRWFLWFILGILWLAALVLGVLGWAQYSAGHGQALDLFDDLYLTLQLVSVNSGAPELPIPLALNLARFALPLLTVATAFKAVWDVFQQQIRNLRMRGLRGHVVICGLSRKGLLLANRFREQGETVVVIEMDEDNPWLEACREQGMYVLVGDASEPTTLRMAAAHNARGVLAVCDNDGINAEIAVRLQTLVQRRDTSRQAAPLVALAHITDPQLCDLLRLQESEHKDPTFRLELFNVFERAAAQLLAEYPAWDDEAMRAGHDPHIVIVGLGRMGENVLTSAARRWHTSRTRIKRKLCVTIIDRYAERKAASLRVRFPQLADDCDIAALQMEVRSAEFEAGAYLVDERGAPAVDRVYVCLDDDAMGLHAGLTIHRRAQHAKNMLVVVRMTEENGLTRLLEDRKNHNGAYKNLVAFGYLNHTCTPLLLKK